MKMSSNGGLLTRSGSLVGTKGMSLDVVVNSAVATKYCCLDQVVNTCNMVWTRSYRTSL